MADKEILPDQVWFVSIFVRGVRDEDYHRMS